MNRRSWITVFAVIAGIVTGYENICQAQGYYLGETDKAYSYRRLLGRWHRSDNGCVLQITNIIVRSGTAELLYFAGSISARIDSAQITEYGNGLRLIIDLGSAGQFGHVYDLMYDRSKNTLSGVYHQPPGADVNVVFQQ